MTFSISYLSHNGSSNKKFLLSPYTSALSQTASLLSTCEDVLLPSECTEADCISALHM